MPYIFYGVFLIYFFCVESLSIVALSDWNSIPPMTYQIKLVKTHFILLNTNVWMGMQLLLNWLNFVPKIECIYPTWRLWSEARLTKLEKDATLQNSDIEIWTMILLGPDDLSSKIKSGPTSRRDYGTAPC